MSYKDMIIALDIDGTLAKDDAYPSEYTYKKIQELINKGYEIILVTGRGYASAKEIYDKCKMTSFCVLHNGALVMNPTTREIIRNITYPENMIFDILNNQELMKYIDDIMIEHMEDVYSSGNKLWRSYQTNGDLKKILVGKEIYTINVWLNDPLNHKKVEEIVNKFENHKYRYWNHQGEIYAITYTKKDGVEALLKHYNKTFDDLLFIGDHDNDIELLKAAGIGVAMKNGSEKAKAAANEMTSLINLEDGAVKYLLHKLNEE